MTLSALTMKGHIEDHGQALCKKLGLKDVFMPDGGGSIETVVGSRQLNLFYDNALGRVVPTYIVFNGTTTFGEPE